LLFRAIFAFLALPGIFAGLIPYALSTMDPWPFIGSTVGIVILTVGLILLLWCAHDFYVAGKGTLAPWTPPKYLVTVGLYRYSRNPMYLSVLLIICGWGLFNGSPLTFFYLLFATLAFHLRVVLHEEPWLQTQHVNQWKTYSKLVPRWLPKLNKHTPE
jgi:protein-S-isoprenylcysteine O-methyltransferase Ste14